MYWTWSIYAKLLLIASMCWSSYSKYAGGLPIAQLCQAPAERSCVFKYHITSASMDQLVGGQTAVKQPASLSIESDSVTEVPHLPMTIL